MARPPHQSQISRPMLGSWAQNGWARAPAAMMPYGIYPQPYYMSPVYVQQQPATIAGVKRPAEVEPRDLTANSKDFHVLWTKAYDKPIPDEVATKCKPLYCELCSVNLNSVIQAKMHYEGKGHDKKVRFALQAWAKDKNTVPPKKKPVDKPPLEPSYLGPSPAQRPCYEFPFGKPSISTPSPSSGLFCGPCDTVFTSHAHAQQHFAGRNHMRVMNGLSPLKAGYFNTKTGKWQRQPPDEQVPPAEQVYEINPALPPPPLLQPPPPPPPEESPSFTCTENDKFYCDVCGVNATSQVQLDMHLNGRNHKVKVGKVAEPFAPTKGDAVQPKPEKVKKDYSIYRTPSGQYYCALCNLCVNSEQQFVQHMVSKKHKLKESSAKGKKLKSNNKK